MFCEALVILVNWAEEPLILVVHISFTLVQKPLILVVDITFKLAEEPLVLPAGISFKLAEKLLMFIDIQFIGFVA